MVKEEVIKQRTLLQDIGYEITCDNMEKFTNKPETSDEYVVWDDDNEVVYCIRLNVNYNTQAKKPVVILQTTYEMIQYFEAVCDTENFKEIMGKIKERITHSDVDIDTIASAFDKYQK